MAVFLSGNPVSYATNPFLARPYTDNMNLIQRTINTMWYIGASMMHSVMRYKLQQILREHLGADVPVINEMGKNVSFILQNSDPAITYPRPYLPNVAEVACIHCRSPKPLPLVSNI